MNDELIAQSKKILEKMDLEKKRLEASALTNESASSDFWSDNKKAGEKMRRLTTLQKEITSLEKLEEFVILGECEDKEELEKIVSTLSDRLYLSGPYDHLGCLISIHSWQGGVEAMDWAQMLYRLYTQ
jgi:peptide chain release factor 2